MLRKRGAGSSRGRKMAKKNIPAALQTEVSTDEEWAKILERKGLVVVDIYSDWSGPCSGMVSILKKIKMEIGGDLLSYATAKCDNISALERFRGKSEPTWMFIHNGRMVNLMFGAYCPELQSMLAEELRRVQNGHAHEFCIPVCETSPEEDERARILEEERTAKEAEKKAQKEAERRAKYEAEMLHYTTSLRDETLVILYSWVFKDADGRKRDRISSPPYVDLVENVLPGNFAITQEIRKRLDDETISRMFAESGWEMDDNARKLLMDGKCMFVRLRVDEMRPEVTDVEEHLLSLLFDEPRLPAIGDRLSQGCFAERHLPAFLPSDKENTEYLPLVWAPPNQRSKATVFRVIFRKYVEATFPYEDKSVKPPIIVFKYDSTRRHELKMVLEMYDTEVVNFGIFERDKPPEARLVASSIDEFDEDVRGNTGYEVFVGVVKKIGCEAFLAFAGIGPYHVSENPEAAIEEAELYFPDVTRAEDAGSDDEDKPEDLEENIDGGETQDPIAERA